MVIKFKNPKTGKILTPDEAFDKFCGDRSCYAGCPLGSLPGTWKDCKAWVCDNIEKIAEVMGLEVVREEEKEEEKMKPKICEILGVEVGEEFRIKGQDGVVFWIRDDGTFATQPVNAPESSKALLRALDHPEWVEHLPLWSHDEVALARVFLKACLNEKDAFFIRKVSGRLYWGVDSGGVCSGGVVPDDSLLPINLFPQIKNGQKVYLRDIVG